jgi:hypothetical protein
MKDMKIKDFLIEKITNKDSYTNNIISIINPDVTFRQVYNEPSKVYDILNVHESSVRVFVFERLEEIWGVEYDEIYNRWLYGNK